MWLEARHQRIQSLLDRLDRVTTEQIVEELDVSRETVRRDLLELEALGVLKRVHGGAIRISSEPSIDKRITTRVKFKQAIARAVAQRIDRTLTLFLDAGSTTTLLAKELSQLSDLVIVTNSFDVALGFNAGQATPGNRVIVLGGDLSSRIAATSGATTVSEIGRYCVDMAVLSPVAVDATYGATSYDPEEAAIAQAMVKNAKKTVILADYSKIGLRSRISYCTAGRIDLLVTNARAVDQEGYKELAAKVREVALV
jgi:DeoR family fructose operon transcriptional repressor